MYSLARCSRTERTTSYLPRLVRLYSSASPSSSHSPAASSKSTLAAKNAATLAGKWKGTDAQGGETKLFSGGEFVPSMTNRFIDVRDPSTQAVLTRVPEPTREELIRTVDAAQSAFEDWRDVSVLARQRIMFQLRLFSW